MFATSYIENIKNEFLSFIKIDRHQKIKKSLKGIFFK